MFECVCVQVRERERHMAGPTICFGLLKNVLLIFDIVLKINQYLSHIPTETVRRGKDHNTSCDGMRPNTPHVVSRCHQMWEFKNGPKKFIYDPSLIKTDQSLYKLSKPIGNSRGNPWLKKRIILFRFQDNEQLYYGQ